jgi:hypothetical protein
MSPDFQTIAALTIVGITVVLLVRSLVRKKKNPGCSSGGACGAVSPEIRKLQRKIRKS